MKRIIVIGIGLSLLIFSLPSWALRYYEDEDDYASLRTQIIIYNLVNGLYLTNEQIRFILEKAEEMSALREKLKRENEDSLSEQTGALLALKEEVKKEAPEVPKELARKIHKNNLRIAKLRKDYINALEEVSREIKSKLTETQLYTIETFKPCLVPPKGPARIGQAVEETVVGKLLERVRGLPQEIYEVKKYEMSARYMEKISLQYPQLKEKELSEAKEKFLEIIDEVRNMSDVDFAIKKQDVDNKIKELVSTDKPVDVNKRITRFLLSKQVIPVLKEKLSEQEEGRLP